MTDLKTERWRNCNHNDRSISTDSAKSQFLFPKEKEKEIDYKVNSRVAIICISQYTQRTESFPLELINRGQGCAKRLFQKKALWQRELRTSTRFKGAEPLDKDETHINSVATVGQGELAIDVDGDVTIDGGHDWYANHDWRDQTGAMHWYCSRWKRIHEVRTNSGKTECCSNSLMINPLSMPRSVELARQRSEVFGIHV